MQCTWTPYSHRTEKTYSNLYRLIRETTLLEKGMRKAYNRVQTTIVAQRKVATGLHHMVIPERGVVSVNTRASCNSLPSQSVPVNIQQLKV